MLIDNLWKKGKDFLGVKYPIISGGMTWISDFDLVKAVCDNGAFGVFAGGNMPPELFEKELDKCIEGIDKPFGVNLITIAPNYRAQYEIVQRKNVPFVIFAGNFPKQNDILNMKKAGKKTLSFASGQAIAERQIAFGIDGLILEGSEAGGHIGYVSLIVLLQQVLFACRDFPIFVAGGLGMGRIMAHLLLMGAAGCQFGTLFVMTEECTAHENFKKVFKRARSREAIATPQYDSKLPVVAVRALKNKAMEGFGLLQLELLKKLESGEISKEQAQFEVENYWVGSLRNAVIDGDVEGGSLMAGQSVGLIDEIKPMKQVIEDLINDAEDEIKRVKGIISSL
ncbi:MAG: nitronate monooxygenase [Armatimonadota bacterium]